MWKLDHKASWKLKNWCFRIVVLKKTLESPLDCKEIQLVHPKGNQPWIFIGRTDADAEAPILWPPDVVRCFSLEKTPMLGKIEGRRRRGWQDEMVRWYHQQSRHESEQALGHGEGQGSLVHCSLWGRKEPDTTTTLKEKTPNTVSESRLVMSDSLPPHGLYSPWNSPGQNTEVGRLSLLQAIFPTQGSNPGLPH